MTDNEPKRGGKRKGAGRKRNYPPTKLRGVYLTEEQAKLLRMWGRGDMSAGLRWLINNAALLIKKTTIADPSKEQA